MAVKWVLKNKAASYRVVQAGNAIRLYRNNVLHSQWNPLKPVSGKLWDLFLISMLGLRKNISSVLVLGAGGGGVINLIHHYYPAAQIQAVDFDNVHLDVAKKYFKVNRKNCEFIYADAQEWLKNYTGERFDLIIDDVFEEMDSIPYRSVSESKSWINKLIRNLKKEGVLVFNFADSKEWNKNFKLWSTKLTKHNIAIATQNRCDNKIVHISRLDITNKNILPLLKQNGFSEYVKYLNNGVMAYKSLNRAHSL